MSEQSSKIDARLGLPGTKRQALTAQLFDQMSAGAGWECDAFTQLARLDQAQGFLSRRAARVIMRRPSDDRFVIFRYPFFDGTNRWIIPGGGAEGNETPTQTALREVLEETGATPTLSPQPLLMLYHVLTSTLRDGRTPTVQYSPIYSGTVCDDLPDTGGRDTHWFTIDEFRKQPRSPISDVVLSVLEQRSGQPVWLPA